MKEKIDDLFRDNIDNRSFDYQDEFWGDIASELDARDKKKKRPFFWVLAGVALPIFIAAGAYYFTPFGEKEVTTTEEVHFATEENLSIENVEENEIEETNETVTKKREDANTPTFTNSQRISKRSSEIVENSNFQKKEEDGFSNKKTVEIKEIDIGIASKDLVKKEKLNIAQVVDNELIIKKPSQLDSSLRPSPKESLWEKGEPYRGGLTESDLDLNNSKKSEIAANNQAAPSRVPLGGGGGYRAKIPELLSLNNTITKLEEPEKAPNFSNQIIPTYKNHSSFWTFGLIATGGIDNQENQFSNWSTGLFADYRFAKNWSIDAAILYGEFTSNFGVTNSSLQTNYSFGRSRQMQKLKAEKLSLLSLPITLNFHQKRHQFGVGIQTDYVLAVHGEKEVFEEQQGDVFARVSAQSGVITKPTEIPNLNFAGTASYQHNFAHFSLGARGRYYFKNYLPTPDLTILPKDLMMFDLILKVKL